MQYYEVFQEKNMKCSNFEITINHILLLLSNLDIN